MKKKVILLIFISLSSISFAQNNKKSQWIDSVYNSLSLEKRFGQLLMIRANMAYKAYNPKISEYIKNYGIGGVCFFSYNPIKQVQQSNQWQRESDLPMLMGIDAEWGLGMRHQKTTISYPYQMTLGAISKDTLLYKMGLQIGEQCKRMGLQMNFAPVVDVNNNPNNPVINSRSFGDNPQIVAQKATQYMHGLQDAGLIATAKHFPGHGDTDTDSHKDLPSIPHSKNRLQNTELLPFRSLIKENLKGIMVAHLYVPAIEKEKNVASTLSHPIVTDLLQKEMGFKGLIVTDGLDMKGVTKHFPAGEIEVRAFLAGNDILLLPANVPAAIKGLCDAYKTGKISETALAQRCKKVLGTKYDLGLYKKPYVAEKNLLRDLNKQAYKDLRKTLFDEAITLVKNNAFLPLKVSEKTAIVNFGKPFNYQNFKSELSKYFDAKYFYINKDLTAHDIDSISQKLSPYDKVIFNFGQSTIFPQKQFGINGSHIRCAYATAQKTATCIHILASPIAVQKLFKQIAPFNALIISHQDNKDTQILSAQKIANTSIFRGTLPIHLNPNYPQGSGLKQVSITRHTKTFEKKKTDVVLTMEHKIDSLVKRGIEIHAFPGCQIFVKHKGQILLHKAYGYFTYDSIQEVTQETIYDLASLTKVLASAPALMYLYQENVIDLDLPISTVLPQLSHSNKATLTWRNILTHQARLQSWIPFYKFYIDKKNGKFNPSVFSKTKTDSCSSKISNCLYINPQYRQAMFDSISNSPLSKKQKYLYSDLGFYWTPLLVQRYTQTSFEDFLEHHFYRPMGLQNTFFRPLAYVNPTRIPPTEEDSVFRKAIVKGYVHDPGAAMLGGVSGHAGLFSNAEEVGKIFEMYLNKGTYQGLQLLDKKVLAEFTKHQFPNSDNRRALCFDKPYEEYDPKGPCCKWASQSSFGHSGFTGTYVWADPQYDLIYVFLSNRSFPKGDNFKISHYDFRTDIHAAIYEAIMP